MRRLLAEEGHRLGGMHRDAHDGGAGPVDAARQIDREHRRAIGVDRLDHRPRVALDRPAQPGAEQRVDDQRRLADRLRVERQHRMFPAACGGGGIAVQCVAFAHQEDADLAALRRQLGGRDEPVAAIVPRSRDDHDRSLRGEVGCEVGGRFRDRLTGTQHQRKAGRTCRDREPVGAIHFSGGENFHPRSPDETPYPKAFPLWCAAPPPKAAHQLIYLPISQASLFCPLGSRASEMPVNGLITFR